MLFLDNMRFKPKLLITYGLIGLLPVIVVSLLTLSSAETHLMNKSFDQLDSLREAKGSAVQRYFTTV